MKPSFSIRAVFSLVLIGIGAIIALDSPETPFVVTETAPAVVPVKPVDPPKPSPAPDPGEGNPISPTICTFRCAACRRAPTLQYHPDAVLPPYAVCKQCGRQMPRTDPPLNAIERRGLGLPQTSQYRQAPQPIQFCRT